MSVKLIGEKFCRIPWEDRKEKGSLPLWRYSQNPIIGREPVEGVSRIFNSGVCYRDNRFTGIFRAERHDGIPMLNLGFSEDGLHWEIEKQPIRVEDTFGKPVEYSYMYDPRLVKAEDKYYIIFCTDNHGATIGLIETEDFRRFVKRDDPFLPFNRNGVLFPRKINGRYAMLSRPSDSGHTPFGDIFYSESPDLVYWGRHRHLMGKSSALWWENVKIGGGCAPIETDVGWLLFYHGVTGTCNGYVYSIGGAILDRDDPSKVLYRSKNFLLTPTTDYETNGFVPNVAFPCSALVCAETGRIAIYYGAADTYMAVAFTTADEVCKYIMDNNEYDSKADRK